MLRFVFLALFLLSSLFAQSDSELLKRANSLLNSPNKSDQFRAYNDYKSLYLRALMDQDEKLHLSALQGIVQSGTKLRIDVSQYSQELSAMPQKSSYKAPKPQEIKTTKKAQNIKLISSHKLTSIEWRESQLVLMFDKRLKSNQVNYFTLYDPKKKSYRYVFDIHASMLSESQSLRKSGVEKIRLAQFDPNTLRLVFENSQKLNIRFKKEGSSLIINVGDSGTQKATSTKTKGAPKRVERNKVIVIDPGHGGKDPGAVGYKGYREKIVVMQISKELKSILESRGYRVYLTRGGDKFLKLRERTGFANRKKADLFISIHANAVGKKDAAKVHGIECYYLDKSRSNRAKKVAALENSADMSEMDFYGKESFLHTLSSHNIIASNKLAIDLQGGMLNSLRKSYKNVKDGGVRPAPFWVLVGAQMPSVLVEVGFITHPTEASRLVNRDYQKKIALGLANGVERYFLNN